MTATPPPKLIRFPALAASAFAAVTVAVLGSFLGTAGTLAGAGLASAAGGIATALYERGIERAAAKARRGRRTPSPQARARAAKLASRKVILRSLAGAAAIGIVTLGVITGAEYAAGRPVSAIVQGKSGGGLTLTGGNPEPASTTAPAATPSAAPSSSPTPTASIPPVSATPTPLVSATLPPTATPSTPPAVIPSTSATPFPSASGGTP